MHVTAVFLSYRPKHTTNPIGISYYEARKSQVQRWLSSYMVQKFPAQWDMNICLHRGERAWRKLSLGLLPPPLVCVHITLSTSNTNLLVVGSSHVLFF